MAKLLGNITFEIIKGLNRIDSLYDPQSILITYREQNVKRGRALFFYFQIVWIQVGEWVTVFVVIRPHCGLWSGLYTFTYNVPH